MWTTHSGAVVESSTKCALAHDFNNQLTIILAHCDFLADQCSASATAQSHLAKISAAARHLSLALASYQCALYELQRAVEAKKPPEAVSV